ncbi:hypothetical protein ABIG06_006219 [Bradyrhizobium sp. USDA 326]
MKHIAPDELQRRPVFVKFDKIALAIVGAVAALAVFWGATNRGPEAAKGAPAKADPPACYSIGTSVSSGCAERAK